MKQTCRKFLKFLIYMILIVFLATLGGYLFQFFHVQETNIVLLYLVAVLLITRYTNEFAWGIFAAFFSTAAFNFFFTKPKFTFSVYDTDYLITFAGMSAASIFIGILNLHARKNADRAMEREADVSALYHLTSTLSCATSVSEIKEAAEYKIGAFLNCTVESSFGPGNEEQALGDDGTQTDKDRNQGSWRSFVVTGQKGHLGEIRIPLSVYERLPEARKNLIQAMTENIGIALDRIHTAEESYRNRELMEQEKYRANLLRSISHDLRTPLMGIMGTSEVLMGMSAQEDPRKKLAENIYQDADWLHSLVENILGLTRLQDSTLTLNRSRQALEELIACAVAHIEKSHPDYEIGVELPDNYIEVEVDARLMTQVFTNLLDNAVKHTLAGNEIKVVATIPDKQQVKIQVMDRGEGIAEEDLPHVFEMFYTSAKRMADVKHGIGLGLAVSAMVVQSYGGTIGAANREDGTGAVFTVILPMAGMEGMIDNV